MYECITPAQFHSVNLTSDTGKTFGLLPDQGYILAWFADIKHDYAQEFYQSYSSFISQCLSTSKFCSVCNSLMTQWCTFQKQNFVTVVLHLSIEISFKCIFNFSVIIKSSFGSYYDLEIGQMRSHYLDHLWPRSMVSYDVNRPEWAQLFHRTACSDISAQCI